VAVVQGVGPAISVVKVWLAQDRNDLSSADPKEGQTGLLERAARRKQGYRK
jgi:hypothetical protein